MSHSIKHFIIYCILFAYLSSGCAAIQLPIAPVQVGEVSNLFRGTSEYVVDSCLAGKCFTEILWNPATRLSVYNMPMFDGVAFTIIEDGKALAELPKEWGAQLVSNPTWIAFRTWLIAHGYIATAIRSNSSLVMDFATSRLTVFMAPISTSEMGWNAMGLGIYNP